ncbi:ATP-dependent Clp protease ATP-binding subunit [Candidatus Uhrbacteria bacterium]|nr:ATP-dependent Clp protease ATP-binding subunit [Candidatus Uhrbacteria bacterium]
MELYFGAKIDRAGLAGERVGKLVRAIFLTIVSAFAVVGIVALVGEALPDVERIFTVRYWQFGGRGKLVFAFSLIADLYLVMRLLRRGEEKEKVHPLLISPLVRGRKKRLKRIDVSRALTEDVYARIRGAYRTAARVKHAEVAPAHLMWALLGSPSVASLLVRLEIDVKGLQDRLKHVLESVHNAPLPPLNLRGGEKAVSSPARGISPPARGGDQEGVGGRGGSDPTFGDTAKQIIITAYQDAQQAQSEYVGAHQVLLQTALADERLKEIFFDLGIDERKLRNSVRWLEINEELRRRWKHFRGAASRRPKGEMNRAMTALQTRALDRFSDDLTRLAGRGYLELTVDRAKEFDEIFRVLEGERKSIILVGPHGVGKEAILNGLAQRMVEEEVPRSLKDRRLVSLSIPKLVSGANPAQAQERLLTCVYDIARSRNVVLALPNVHELIGASAGAGLDLGETLATELEKGYFLAIATTTAEEYQARIEGSPLGNACIKIEVEEPEVNTAIHILESKVGPIEHQSGVYFSYNALEKAVVLSDRFLKEQALPEKAIDMAKESAELVRNRRGAKALVRGEDAAEIISAKSHVPVTSVTAAEADKLLNLEKIMHARIIGQDEAVKAVSASLRRARAEIREQKRPIANFLFLGPTGVGKTETAKTVAEVYFGNEAHMARVDMSEYQDKGSVHRLLGAPGEHGGLLTEPVRKNPFSLVLLDEIEKAHPDILNVFLQVMDDGRVTDSAGRVVDFTNTIIIGTSNAGTPFIQEELKKGTALEEIKKTLVERELKQYFRPEFLNRFDAVIVYKPLSETEIVQIAKLMLAKVGKQLEAKGITFRATDEAVSELAHAGFDPLFGARPLRRVIQERVNDALANLLLTAKLGRRDLVILEKGGQLRVEKAEKL